jgi:hypothetical protein
MPFSAIPKTPNVNLTKYVNLGEDQWRFCPVVIAGNGRIKPDYVLAAGRAELHREGSYYLEWYEDGSRRRRSVGKNALEAHAQIGEQRRRRKITLVGVIPWRGLGKSLALCTQVAHEHAKST